MCSTLGATKICRPITIASDVCILGKIGEDRRRSPVWNFENSLFQTSWKFGNVGLKIHYLRQCEYSQFAKSVRVRRSEYLQSPKFNQILLINPENSIKTWGYATVHWKIKTSSLIPQHKGVIHKRIWDESSH